MSNYNYKVTLNGGTLNGAERYYDTWWKAEQQAKRYITSMRKKCRAIGGGGIWVEIEQVNRYTGSKELLDIIE